MIVDVVIEAGNWPEDASKWAEEIAVQVATHFGLEGFETTVLFTDDKHIQELNAEFREKDKATDVLSWPSFAYDHKVGEAPALPQSGDGPFDATLGDIALGYETCLKDSAGKDFSDHIRHLILHGFLHLLGYDHIDDRDASLMESLEVEILEKMHINNPYIEKQV